MAELADALDLGSSGQPCGFDPHYPYQKVHRIPAFCYKAGMRRFISFSVKTTRGSAGECKKLYNVKDLLVE